MAQVATMLACPAAAYLVLLAAIYGLTFAGFNLGARVASIGGAVALAIALACLHAVAASYAALALVSVGALLMVAEFHLPLSGLLGLIGIAGFVLGSIALFDVHGLARAALAVFAVAGAIGQLRVIHVAMRRRRRQRVPHDSRRDM